MKNDQDAMKKSMEVFEASVVLADSLINDMEEDPESVTNASAVALWEYIARVDELNAILGGETGLQ